MKNSKQAPTKEQLTAFAIEHSWERQMRASDNYPWIGFVAGESPGDVVVVAGRNRDSDILEESNFEATLERLGGESKNVEVHRFGHWGCGWFELITVNPKATAKLRIAYEIKAALESYPVLDESDFCEREHEQSLDYARGAKHELAEALCIHFGLPEEFHDDKAMVDLAFELNMTCQSYYGNDSCVNVYKGRNPDVEDIERLETCMCEIAYNMSESEAYKYIAACLDLSESIRDLLHHRVTGGKK